MSKRVKQILFFVCLVIGMVMIIHGTTRVKQISGSDEVIEHYELKETKSNASTLCLSCMGID